MSIALAPNTTSLGTSFRMKTVQEPFKITEIEYQNLKYKGELVVEWMSGCIDIYKQALSGKAPAWITGLLESGYSQEEIGLQRELVHKNRLNTPSFFRLDMADLNSIVEVQVNHGGDGYSHTISQQFRNNNFGSGFVEGYVSYLKKITGKTNPTIFFIDSISPSDQALWKQISNAGINIQLASDSNSSMASADIIVGADYKFLTNDTKCAQDLKRKFLTKEVTLTSPPVSFFSMKSLMALPFMPETQTFFSDRVRDLFPKTYLIDHKLSKGILIDKEFVTWEKLSKLPDSKRRFVVKFAGMYGIPNDGAQSVFKLDGGSSVYAEKLLTKCLQDSENNLPWIIQERVKTSYDLSATLGKDYCRVHTRITPVFSNNGNLIGGSINFSPFWKVHGNINTLVLAIAVQN